MALQWDVFNNIKIDLLTVPAVKTATVTSDAADMAGYEGARFDVIFGESGNSLCGGVKWDCKLQESDDDVTYADVDADDVIGNTSDQFGLVDDAASDGAVYSLGYKGIKRYVKVVVTATGTHGTGIIITIAVNRFKSINPPSNVVNA